MAEMKAKYLGGLQVECEHLKSGAKLMTSPQAGTPVAGETFSPTGLCAAALSACVLTMMGAYATKNGLDIEGAEIETSLAMGEEPHRIASITLIINMPPKGYSDKEKKILERVAKTCPVGNSLSEQLVRELVFNWQ